MRRYLIAATLLAIAACSKEKNVEPPAELTEFNATLRVQRVWSAGVDGAGEQLRLGLGLGVDEGRVYAAGRNGAVAAFELESGRRVWETRTRAPLAGGTGVGGGLVAVGSSDGEVIALNAADGAIRWRVRVDGEVLSAPAVSEQAVVVRTGDGKLRALAPADGKEMWLYEQQVPLLSLRGTSRPVIAGDLTLCGFDNGKIVAVRTDDGALAWEASISVPSGRTEIERLVDVDSAVRVQGNDVYTVGFQGRAAMLALETGQIWWSQELSSYRGLGLDANAVYVSTDDGQVVALRRQNGTELWRQDQLRRRGLSTPVATDDAVVVGDFQGYVHWLDKTNGGFAARASAGGARISSPPVFAGGLVLVINDEGRITAFRTSPMASPEAAQPAAPATPTETPPSQ